MASTPKGGSGGSRSLRRSVPSGCLPACLRAQTSRSPSPPPPPSLPPLDLPPLRPPTVKVSVASNHSTSSTSTIADDILAQLLGTAQTQIVSPLPLNAHSPPLPLTDSYVGCWQLPSEASGRIAWAVRSGDGMSLRLSPPQSEPSN